MEETAPETTIPQPAPQNPDTNRAFELACRPHVEHLHYAWGDDRIEDAMKYVALATLPWRAESKRLAKAIKANPAVPTLVIVVERGSPPHGQPRHNEQYLAAFEACRSLNNSSPFHLVFTGGCYGLETLAGEKPALDMAHEFDALTGGIHRHRLTIDQLSQNTGHQARLLGQMIKTFRIGRVALCAPIEHIARLAATLAHDLKERSLPVMFHFLANGAWNDVIPQRGMTRAQEAFGPVQDEETAPIPTKRLGGEYADRLAAECDPRRNSSLICQALSPADMLAYLRQNPT